MTEGVFCLTESRELTPGVRLMKLEGDSSSVKLPGEFVQVAVDGFFLRRPFSVCDWGPGWLSILVAAAGAGTGRLQQLPTGSQFSVITGLGHGYEPELAGRKPLLIGAGTGLSPLVGLARRMGPDAKVLLGFRGEPWGQDLFTGLDVTVTDDIFRSLKELPHDSFFACGSKELMRALCARELVPGQVAFDLRLGCGFGLCMGCSVPTVSGLRKFCKDGPVFRKEELCWED